jgi:hypothetical protein
MVTRELPRRPVPVRFHAEIFVALHVILVPNYSVRRYFIFKILIFRGFFRFNFEHRFDYHYVCDML